MGTVVPANGVPLITKILTELCEKVTKEVF